MAASTPLARPFVAIVARESRKRQANEFSAGARKGPVSESNPLLILSLLVHPSRQPRPAPLLFTAQKERRDYALASFGRQVALVKSKLGTQRPVRLLTAAQAPK